MRYVYDFAEGDKDKKDLLGGKGANLSEMIKIGLNVPPGFTVTTDACRAYLHGGAVPVEMADQVTEQLANLEAKIGRTLGDPANPLLVSVRSGAKFSMPGMMETVLNIGMSDASVAGLTEFSGDERFAWDSYRRLIQMFGKTVLGIEGHFFEHAIDQAKTDAGVKTDVELGVPELQALVATYKGIVKDHAGIDFPQ
ncbi:MAG: pyruvate, phosphate dikinase, partial [Candidatus Nanopelagicales bacterium]|nr:pyruvate, phosphate dikinase [Candidatus Nanopelagicales bacterium]